MNNTDLYRKLAEESARKAGELLLDNFSLDPGVSASDGKDIKTAADKAAETVILEGLSETGLPMLSEESGAFGLDDLKAPCWIVDPLDGTFNFTRDFPICCVSIGLWADDAPVLGVIYDFINDTLYSGIVGVGAQKNGIPLHVSDVSDLADAALATGFPSARDYSDESLAACIRKVQEFKKIRMIGSAAMALVYVAAGNMDAYFEEDIWLWDVAAGLALVVAAGGKFRMTEVKCSWQVDISAWNGRLDSFHEH